MLCSGPVSTPLVSESCHGCAGGKMSFFPRKEKPSVGSRREKYARGRRAAVPASPPTTQLGHFPLPCFLQGFPPLWIPQIPRSRGGVTVLQGASVPPLEKHPGSTSKDSRYRFLIFPGSHPCLFHKSQVCWPDPFSSHLNNSHSHPSGNRSCPDPASLRAGWMGRAGKERWDGGATSLREEHPPASLRSIPGEQHR